MDNNNLSERLRELLPDESDWDGFILIEWAADMLDNLQAELTQAQDRVTHLEYWISDAYKSADSLRIDMMCALEDQANDG